MAVRRRFLSPLWLIFSLPGYLGWRLLPSLTHGPMTFCLGVGVILTMCVLVPLSVSRPAIKNQLLASVLSWTGLVAMGFFSTLFVLTVMRDLLLAAVWAVGASGRYATLNADSTRLVLALAALFTLVGYFLARHPRTVRIDIPVADLPRSLQGFSIAQLSDVHVGPTIKRGFVESLVRRVNALKTDVIALTGDFVDGSVDQLSIHTAPLADLRARHGVYFVPGNHEYYSGEAAWSQEFRRIGLTVLKNEHVVLLHEGASVVIGGVTDYSAHHFNPAERSDPGAAIAGAPPGAGARILLAHQPSTAPAAAAAGFDVQISGHTHGGQFWPWNHCVRYFQPFTAGLHKLNNLVVYVNSGTGYWGPPNRFGVPSEITHIRLVRASHLMP